TPLTDGSASPLMIQSPPVRPPPPSSLPEGAVSSGITMVPPESSASVRHENASASSSPTAQPPQSPSRTVVTIPRSGLRRMRRIVDLHSPPRARRATIEPASDRHDHWQNGGGRRPWFGTRSEGSND